MDERQNLLIKNMVCPRCVMVVRDTLEELGLKVLNVELGKAEIKPDDTIADADIDQKLQAFGFELIHDENHKLTEQIKTQLIGYVQKLETTGDDLPNLSDYLSAHLHQNYASLSSTFSQSEEVTIEKYLINLKIERVKELLSYGEMTLSEIAYRLKYSSVAYLSRQFKKVTGLSVTDYKKARDSFRKPLDGIQG